MRNSIRFLIALLVVLCASGMNSARAAETTSRKIPILVYHHIRETKSYPKSTWSYKMSVSPILFASQMQWIADHGYTTIDLDAVASMLSGETSGPAKPVVITFDDNNPTQYSEAFSVLKKHGETAVFYIITNRIGNKSFLTADQLKEMDKAGMDIESHTVSHASLSTLSPAKMDEELVKSKKVLEELLGKTVRHIAYPSTMQNKTVRERAKLAGYVTGTIMDPRTATSKDDLLKLPRIMMIDTTDLKKVLP